MTTERSFDLMDELAALASHFDRAAPPVRPSEARAIDPSRHSAGGGRTVVHVLVAAAVAVAVIGGLVLVTGRDGQAPVTVPLQVDDTVGATFAPTTVASTTSSTAGAPAFADQLAAIEAEVIPELASLSGFRATATVVRVGTDANGAPVSATSTNEVTLLGNGSMWTTMSNGGWGSFDPATGLTRGAFPDGAGGVSYQLIEGWSDNSVGVNILLGHDPIVMPTSISGAVESITEVDHDGRPGWEIRTTEDELATSYVIDRATGLLVAFVHGEDSMSLTALSTDVSLPPEFPGSFPEGADVQRSGDPNAFQPMSIEDAVTQFGTGAMTPDPFDPATGASVAEVPATYDGGYSTVQKRLVLQLRSGFLRTEVTVFKEVVVTGAPPAGSGMIIVDGMECTSSNGVACDVIDEGSVLTAGPLAGFAVEDAGTGYIVASNGPIQVWISAPTADAARTVLESLRPVSAQPG